MHHNWFNVQFSRCILNLIRDSVKHQFLGASINLSTFHFPLSTFHLLVVESTGIEPVTSCLQGRRSPSWANPPDWVEWTVDSGQWTVDSFLLYNCQLSTVNCQLLRKWWAKMDSNHRPHDYQSCALASWAIGPSCLHFLRAVPSKLNNVKYSSLCTDLRTLLARNLSY